MFYFVGEHVELEKSPSCSYVLEKSPSCPYVLEKPPSCTYVLEKKNLILLRA